MIPTPRGTFRGYWVIRTKANQAASAAIRIIPSVTVNLRFPVASM